MRLDAFVMVRFADDLMLKPAESAVSIIVTQKGVGQLVVLTQGQWFWTNDEHGDLVPLEKQSLYKEDWLGLRELGPRLRFLVSPGQHVSHQEGIKKSSSLLTKLIVQMQISDEFFEKEIVWPYLAAAEDENSNTDRVASPPRLLHQLK